MSDSKSEYEPEQVPIIEPDEDPEYEPEDIPAAPASMIDPIVNHGPDADQFRDVATGQVVDASDTHRPMTTFTAHRSPLGLSFDSAGALCGDFKSNAFILSWGAANPVFPDHGATLDSLYKSADLALYEAKRRLCPRPDLIP